MAQPQQSREKDAQKKQGDTAQKDSGDDLVQSSPAARHAAEGEQSDEITGETMKSRQSQM